MTFEGWYRINGYYHDTINPRKELMEEAYTAGQESMRPLVENLFERLREHCQTLRLNGCDMMNDKAYSSLAEADNFLGEKD